MINSTCNHFFMLSIQERTQMRNVIRKWANPMFPNRKSLSSIFTDWLSTGTKCQQPYVDRRRSPGLGVFSTDLRCRCIVQFRKTIFGWGFLAKVDVIRYQRINGSKFVYQWVRHTIRQARPLSTLRSCRYVYVQVMT